MPMIVPAGLGHLAGLEGGQHPACQVVQRAAIVVLAELDGLAVVLLPAVVVGRHERVQRRRGLALQQFTIWSRPPRWMAPPKARLADTVVFGQALTVAEFVPQRASLVRRDRRPGRVGPAGQLLGDLVGVQCGWQSSPASAAIGRTLQLVDQLAGLADAEVFGVVDAVSLLQGDGQVEALAIGDGVEGTHLAGGGLAAVGRGLPLPLPFAAWPFVWPLPLPLAA